MLTKRDFRLTNKFPYLIISGCLLFVLLLPFLLLYEGPKTELYPAVLLPAGLGVDYWTASGSEHQFPAFYGYNDHDEVWQQLDVEQTLYPLSATHSYAVNRYLHESKDDIPKEVWDWLNTNLVNQRVRADTILIGLLTDTLHPKQSFLPTLTDEIYLGAY